ncbi:MAG: cyclase family protein [Bacteroidota bacterium]
MRNPRIIDISMPLREPMRGFSKSTARTMERDGWNATELKIYSHAGTHMDAPLHFDVNSKTIDQVPPDRFVCECHIIRIPDIEPGGLLTMDYLADVSEKIKMGQAVIFNTGWSRYHDNPEMYRNKLPRISKDLAEWLALRGVNLIGVEPPSVADVNKLEELQEIHKILLEADILILEGLTNLESVKADFVKLIALPLKIEGGDGAPVRAIIMEES